MTIILFAVASVVFGLLWGRLYVYWCDVRDEEDAMSNARLQARIQTHRYDEMLVDEPYVPAPRRSPFYDWAQDQ